MWSASVTAGCDRGPVADHLEKVTSVVPGKSTAIERSLALSETYGCAYQYNMYSLSVNSGTPKSAGVLPHWARNSSTDNKHAHVPSKGMMRLITFIHAAHQLPSGTTSAAETCCCPSSTALGSKVAVGQSAAH